MRVAIDATPLTLSSGGLRRYTQELSVALAENFPQDEFFLVSDQRFSMPHMAPLNLRRGGGPRHPAERRWWLWGLDRELHRLEAGLFHGTDFAVPYLPRRPSVLTLHDLSPWMDAAWHSSAGRVRQRTPLLIGLGLATMIVTPSEAVRKQAIERFRIHPDRIRAVPHAASACFRPRSARDSVAAPPGPPYFLYAGTLEPRKNIPGLLAAWREVRRLHSVDLVLAGRRRSDFAQLSPESGLQIIGEVSDERLAQLLAGTLAFVYPSFYEGFGLPVLEAMQCGACVITSRDPARCSKPCSAGLASSPRGIRRCRKSPRAPLSKPARTPNWCAPCWISRRIPSGLSHGRSAGCGGRRIFPGGARRNSRMRSMKKLCGGRRGAGTRACRDGTLAVAHGRFCRARPGVVVRASYESGFHGIVFDVSHNSLELVFVSDPVVVRLSLPKGLAGTTEYQVSFTRGAAFQRAKQTLRRNFGPQEYVDMVGHDHPSPQLVVAKLEPALQRIHYNAGYVLPAQVHWADSGCIKVTIHPDKRLSGSESGRRIPTLRQAAVQMPGYEEPFAFRIDVREAATGFGHKRKKWFQTGEDLLSKPATARVPSRQAGVPAPHE